MRWKERRCVRSIRTAQCSRIWRRATSSGASFISQPKYARRAKCITRTALASFSVSPPAALPSVCSVCAALDAAGFEAIRSTDIRLDVWTKLIGNLSFNPIAALTGYLMSEIVSDEDVLDVIRAMMREGMQVSEHYGVRIPMTVEQRIDLARQLGAAKISMLQDLSSVGNWSSTRSSAA